jgi:predicted SAM-dependent methyltransferase
MRSKTTPPPRARTRTATPASARAALQALGIRYSPAHPDGIRRVQVGCGPHHLRLDWWNTDLRAFPGIDDTLDATKPWPWPERLDYVYAEHFLEHLTIDQAVDFLVEAGRALRPGGRIRLSTPSLEWVLKTHFSFQPAEAPENFMEAVALNRAFYAWGHQFLYTNGTLERLMRDVGYQDVRFYPYGVSDTPAFDGLELHETEPDADGYPAQWIVEAERGERDFAAPPDLMALLDKEILEHVRPGH